MALEHEVLTERIIGAAIEVQRRHRPGFLAKATLEPKRVIASGAFSCIHAFLIENWPGAFARMRDGLMNSRKPKM